MKKLLLLLTMMISMAGWAAKPTTMYIWMKDGSKTIFQLSEKPRLTFTDEEMTVRTTETSITLPYQQLKNITYQDVSVSIKNVNRGEKAFIFDGQNLAFTASDKALKVMIVRTDGATVRQLTVRPNESATIPSSKLPKGNYVVVVNGVTYKIMKL